MARLNWSKAKTYKSDNFDYSSGKSLSFKDQEKLESRRSDALTLIATYNGNNNFINSLKCKRLISIKQVEVVEKIFSK